jgi:hypothetical protein
MSALQSSLSFFVNVLIEIIPLFLAVTFLAGLALEYIKPKVIRERLGGKKGITGILSATVLGFVTPFCSCSTIPLLAGMMAAGIPLSILTAFLFASPYPIEVGVIVLGPMFGWSFAIVFVATGAVIAILSGLLMQRLNWQNQVKDDFVNGLSPAGHPEAGAGCNCSAGDDGEKAGCCDSTTQEEAKASECGCAAEEEKKCSCRQPEPEPQQKSCCAVAEPSPSEVKDGFPQKARRAALYSLNFFKRMFLFILLGSTMGALIYGFVPADLLATYMGGSSLLAVPIAALIGVPLYVSIIPVIPIILSLSAKGVSTGAVIAFMITATSISPPELIMLSGMFKRRYLGLFVVMMIVGAIVTGYMFNLISV